MYQRSKRSTIAIAAMLYLAAIGPANRLFAAATMTQSEWQKLTNDKAFSYKNDVEFITPPKQMDIGPLERLISALFLFLNSGAGKLLLWCIVIGIVVFIVYRLLLSKDSVLFGKRARSMKAVETTGVQDEDLATTNWEALMQSAAANNDLRLAVRCSYMWLLQMLQRKELIAFSSDKTNFDYYTELGGSAYKQPFRQLSRQYEYTWYGRFAISGAEYEQYVVKFNDLKKQLGA